MEDKKFEDFCKSAVPAFFSLVCFVILIAILILFGSCDNRYKRESERLREELAKAQQYVPLIRGTIRDSVETVTQKIVEVEKIKEVLSKEDKQMIKDLGIKMSELQAFQKMGTASGDTLFLAAGEQQPAGQATIEQGDSLPDGEDTGSDSLLRYKDAWLEFTYWPKSRKLAWQSKDTFDIAVKKEFKHRFLFFKWGTKGYWTNLVSHNKRTRITYNSFVMKE